jgi:hypothetical protein
MVRSLHVVRWSLVLLAIPLAACADKVVRQGEGWREIESKEPGKTQIQVTSDDPRVLAELAKTNPDGRVRADAQRRIKDPAVLAELARGEQDPALRKLIVIRLTDEAVLKAIAASDSDPKVQQVASARAEMLKSIDARHPEYAGWSSCNPGTWVKLKVQVKVNGTVSNVEIVRTLLECSPERAILEQRVVSTGLGPQGMARDLLGRFDVAYGRKVEDDGDLSLQGRTIKAKWVRYNFQRGGDIAQIRRWLNNDVPSGVARIDMEVSPEGQPLSQLTAVAQSWEKR